MNIHEYQAKEILRRFGVPVADGGVAFTPEEAETVARTLKTDVIAVKSQIHAGGRGKAGGIKLVKTPEEAAKATRELIGKVLVTHQTGPHGKQVRKVLIEAGSIPKRELYLSILIDRSMARPSFLASTEGGVDIEAVAAKTPGEDSEGAGRPGHRRATVPGAQDCLCARPRRPTSAGDGQFDPQRLSRVHRDRRVADRDQSADHRPAATG